MNKVMLIDDDRAVNFFNKQVVLRHHNFEHLVTVQSGAEALAYLDNVARGEAIKPNVIFLDINMPSMNGWEFLDIFREKDVLFKEDIKIIILTTSSNPKYLEKSKTNEDVIDFINKPLSFSILDHVFKKHVLLSNATEQ